MMKQKEKLCIVFNIENPLNYDIGFPDDPNGILFSNEIKRKKHEYSICDRDTLICSEYKEIMSFRARLYNINPIPNNKNRKSEEGNARFYTIRWNNKVGGVFYYSFHGFDVYDRLLIKLYDPVTGECINDWLAKKYSTLYSIYKK